MMDPARYRTLYLAPLPSGPRARPLPDALRLARAAKAQLGAELAPRLAGVMPSPLAPSREGLHRQLTMPRRGVAMVGMMPIELSR